MVLTLLRDVVDAITNPSSLNFNAGRAVGEQSRSMGSIQVEHVGIAGHLIVI